MIPPLACPRCGADLREDGRRRRCPCGSYPVVEGIPVLTDEARDRDPDLGTLLARHRPPPRTRAGSLLRRLFPGAARLARAATRPGATFLDAAARLGRASDLDYFRYRFSDPSYVASCAFLAPLTEGPVLDLCCGAGHVTRALVRKLPGAAVVGLDLNFSLLFLARRFVAPEAPLVCADAAGRLPFRDGAFAAAVCADAFYFLRDRARAAAELLRVTRGPILVPHLQDPAFRGPSVRPPLSPAEALGLFRGRDPRLHSERRILERFLADRVLDLSGPEPRADEPVSLSAGVAPRVYPDADFFTGGRSINPLYAVREEGDALALEARRPHPFLPAALRVTRRHVAEGDPELARKFVLLDLPPRYA